MFDSGISTDIEIGPDQRPVDFLRTRENIIKYLGVFDLPIRADFLPDGILEVSCCGLRDPFFLLAKMELLKRAFSCKREMRDPIPEGSDLQGLNFPIGFQSPDP